MRWLKFCWLIPNLRLSCVFSRQGRSAQLPPQALAARALLQIDIKGCSSCWLSGAPSTAVSLPICACNVDPRMTPSTDCNNDIHHATAGSKSQATEQSLLSPDSFYGGAAAERSPWAQGIPTDTPYRTVSASTMHEGSNLSRSLYGGADSSHSSPSHDDKDSEDSTSPGGHVEYSFDQPAEAQSAHGSQLKRPAASVSAGLDELAVTSRLDSAMDQALLMGHHELQALPEQQHGGLRTDGTARRSDPDGLLSPLSLISHGPSLEHGSAAGALCGRTADHDGSEWALSELRDLAQGNHGHATAPQASEMWPGRESGDPQQDPAPEAAGVGSWPGLEDRRLTEEGSACDARQQQEEQVGDGGSRSGAWAGTAAGDALLAAMAAVADAEGPIELDTAMLYSPVSTDGQLSNTPAPPEPAPSPSPHKVRYTLS